MHGASIITDHQFTWLSDYVKQLSGLNLHAGKRELVKARLAKRLRTLGFTDFSEYVALIRSDQGEAELPVMLDALTTHQTSFFRDAHHLEDLVKLVLPHARERRLVVWSAGCSSGEETYSIVLALLNAKPEIETWDFRVLGTDLSRQCIERARRGVYPCERLAAIPTPLKNHYFAPCVDGPPGAWGATRALRRFAYFAQLNLVESWPLRRPFDAIFCRNVMIYFERPNQMRLVNRFFDLLRPGGFLFIGSAESLSNLGHRFRYVKPTVYVRP